MAEAERVICRVDALIDRGFAVRFSVTRPGEPRDLPCFAIAFDGAYYAYINSCPHRGTELDWQAGEVFEESGLYLMCATHGALFAPDSGLCVDGPCRGSHLRPLAIKVRGNEVVLLNQHVEISEPRNENPEP